MKITKSRPAGASAAVRGAWLTAWRVRALLYPAAAIVAGLVGGRPRVRGWLVRHDRRGRPGYDREAGRLGRQLGVSPSPSIHEWAAFATDLQHAGVFVRAFNGDRFTLGWDSDMEAVTLLTLLEGDVCWAVEY